MWSSAKPQFPLRQCTPSEECRAILTPLGPTQKDYLYYLSKLYLHRPLALQEASGGPQADNDWQGLFCEPTTVGRQCLPTFFSDKHTKADPSQQGTVTAELRYRRVYSKQLALDYCQYVQDSSLERGVMWWGYRDSIGGTCGALPKAEQRAPVLIPFQ